MSFYCLLFLLQTSRLILRNAESCGLILFEFMRKKLLFIYLVIFILFTGCYIYPSYEQVVSQRNKIKSIPFEKEKWFDEKGIGKEALWDTRPGLARDLIDRKLLIGKGFEEIIELLGNNEMDKKTKSVSYNTFTELGAVDPVFMEFLYIYFDENNKVEKAEIKIQMMDGHPDYR